MTEAPVIGQCEAGAGPSGIDLGGLPPLPDAEALEAQARKLSSVGAALEEGARAAARRWSGLAGVYEAPEAGVVLGGFAPVVSRAERVAGLLVSVAAALGRYAERSRELRGRVEELRGSVAALDALILGNDDWQSKHPILNQHRDTYNQVSALAQEILNSDAECASELRGLVGGSAVSAPVVGKLEIGTSKDPFSNALSHVRHFFGDDDEHPEQPWGPPTPSMRLTGGWAFGQGVVSAALGSAQGVYTLVGTSDVEEQRQAGQALGGLIVAGARTAVASQRGMRNLSADDLNAIMTVGEAGKSALRIGKWENDFAFSAGSVSFDVGSLFVGGGAVVKGTKEATAVRLGLEKAWTILSRVDEKGAPLPGYKGGAIFDNVYGTLPGLGVTYREWDTNPQVKGVRRGPERIVTGSDGSAYWTRDHYDTFTILRGPNQ